MWGGWWRREDVGRVVEKGGCGEGGGEGRMWGGWWRREDVGRVVEKGGCGEGGEGRTWEG